MLKKAKLQNTVYFQFKLTEMINILALSYFFATLQDEIDKDYGIKSKYCLILI